jgi:hypothetical protein
MAVASTSTTTWRWDSHADASTQSAGELAGVSLVCAASDIAVLPEVFTRRNADQIGELGQATAGIETRD